MSVTTELVQPPAPCDPEEDPQILMSLVEDFLLNDMEAGSPAFMGPSENMERVGFFSPPPFMSAVESTAEIGRIPQEDAIEERETQVRLLHLLVAYGEAVENRHKELTEVIMASLKQRGNPYGKILERIVFAFCEKQPCYLRHECCKNLELAFRALYQALPYGRVAHFGANATILESLTADMETIRIVDFDMGEGVQWPPLIEALAAQNRAVTLRLTSIKWGVEDDDRWVPLVWSFEEAKRRLVDHARSLGLKLIVEEITMEDLVREMKRTKKRSSGGKEELFVFNCMLSLPHMARVRSRKLAEEFLCVAKEITGHSKGVLVLGDGGVCENFKACSNYGSFLEGLVGHYHALLESMEFNFPIDLVQARISIECLFISPYISPHAWLQKWREMNGGCYNVEMGNEFQGIRVGKECYEEVGEIVKEEQCFYGVRIGGHQENEMVLEWKGIPLVRVSSWRL